MSKLQANWLLVNMFLSNGLEVQFNFNECIVRDPDGEVIVMRLCKDNLYKINFTKVHRADAANFTQLSMKDGVCEFGYH